MLMVEGKQLGSLEEAPPGLVTGKGFRERAVFDLMLGSRLRESLKVREGVACLGIPLVQQRDEVRRMRPRC